MENRWKIGFSRIFCSSLRTCRPRNASDVAQEPVFIAFKDCHLLEPPLPPPPLPKLQKFPSIWKKKSIEPDKKEEKKCPPAPPASPLNSCFKLQEIDEKIERSKKKKPTRKKNKKRNTNENKKKKKKKIKGKENMEALFSSSSSGFFSSDEKERLLETDNLFSSKSFSSDSCQFLKLHDRRRHRFRRNTKRASVLNGKVKESVAVVKRSNDPYTDFKKSMMEMIIDKQIYAAKDLEQLLYCFLSLNSSCHHRIIVEVFTEIWEALLTNWI